MVLDNLTDAERARLQAALESRRSKRSEHPRPSTPQGTTASGPVRVDLEEYNRRLAEELASDKEIADAMRQRTINAFMEQWTRRVDPRWAEARSDDPKILDRINRLVTREGLHKTSLVCAGLYGVGKTWAAYAYAAQAIKAGALTPDQIVDVSEASIANIANAGFETEKRLKTLLHPRHKFFLIDDVGQAAFQNEEPRMAVWYEVINHIYSKQLTLVITTNLSLRPARDASGNLAVDPVTQRQITQSPLEIWLGPAAFDRLRHIVGGWNDGVLVPGDKNMRDEVLRRREEAYHNGR